MTTQRNKVLWASTMVESAAELAGFLREYHERPREREARRSMVAAFMNLGRRLLPDAAQETVTAIVELCVMETVRAAAAEGGRASRPVECRAAPLVDESDALTEKNTSSQDKQTNDDSSHSGNHRRRGVDSRRM